MSMNEPTGARQILVHGLAFMGAGLAWGLVVPHTPYPRLAMGAHIQLTGSGLLFLVAALLLLTAPHSVGRKSIAVMQLAAWLTWLMALSEVANSWWGTNQTLPIAASQAGATGGLPWQETVVKVAHMGAATALLVAWVLLIIGFVRQAPQAK
jgi:(hydroxyamino)benzene mutase